MNAAPIDDTTMLGRLEFYGCRVEPCGSRVTCSPPPVDTDQDYLIEIVTSFLTDGEGMKKVSNIVHTLTEEGFKWEGDEHYQEAAAKGFMSWRRGSLNLIVTADSGFSDRHRCATALAKRLNLMDKGDRIALFQAVLYGNTWEGEVKPPPVAEEIAF